MEDIVLFERNGIWVETPSSAYRRYKHTIEPLEKLLTELEEEECKVEKSE